MSESRPTPEYGAPWLPITSPQPETEPEPDSTGEDVKEAEG